MAGNNSKNMTYVIQACDITHGGLSLSESQGWVETKKEIEQADMKVVQWHRDEISDKVST